MHDEALMIQWNRRGDSEAFRMLTQRYGRMVYATALRVLGNPADAEDVAQDCFEKLARTSNTPGGYLGPWLHRMAVNRALDRVRSDGARKRRETAYEGGKPSSTELDWDDIYPLVDEAIDRLPEKLRRALVAHYLEGLTHDEIAQRESVSRAAITQRIHRALTQMRTTLQRKGIAMPGVAILAGALGSRMAEAAVLPISLTEKLGRIALAGPVVGATGAVTGIAALSKVAIALLAALLLIAGGIAITQNLRKNPPVSATLQQMQADTQTVPSHPAENLNENSRANSPRPIPLKTELAANHSEEDASISGYVFDRETGLGIPEVEMVVVSPNFRRQMTTDEAGAYYVDGIPPGQYYVVCGRANGYYIPSEGQEDLIDEYGRRVALKMGQHFDVPDFAFSRGESHSAQVVNAEMKPISDALVTAQTTVKNHPITNTTKTNAEGMFTVSGFPSTVALYLWAEKDGLVSETYGPSSLPQVDGREDVLVLQPEAIVRGFVLDANGSPLPGLKVVPQFSLSEASREIETVSDSQGRFELKGMFSDSVLMRVCRDVQIVNAPIRRVVLSPSALSR
jgi:RNA polymerase sigma-70 factor (ECF subfamily)